MVLENKFWVQFVGKTDQREWRLLFSNANIKIRSTQRIFSVNYLFGRSSIPYNYLKGIFTSNVRDTGYLRPDVFEFEKMSFWTPKKGQLRFSERNKT